jgi:beta-lactamase regulating signal transducer with metallopeptidase domain
MNPIHHLLPEKLVAALGWTLLHSLWQGALIALLAGLALILLRKRSAAVRYYVTLTALATVFLLAVVTFLGYYGATGHAATPAVVLAPVSGAAHVVAASGGSGLPSSLTGHFTDYFAGHFPLVVLLWAAGVLVLLLRLVGGLAYAARMKSYQVTDADAGWQQKTASLAERLGLRRPARLLESGLAKVPMTIGYLKPVILLPLGALAGLAPAQVEAILAHELAHIRRHDYLVNLVQSLLEILLFYHPAVWWLSARVREEREHCCDDLAVALCSDSVTFARALVRLEERYGQAPALAMAATGRDGMLLGRIKRLLAPGRRTPTFVEGFIVALVLLAGVGVVSVSAARPPENRINLNAPPAGKSAAPVREPAERTAQYFQWSDSTDRRSDVIIVKDKKGNVVELYVDGRRIPDKQIANYRQRIDQALAEQKKRRYSDSPERDVNTALRRLDETGEPGERWTVYGDPDAVPPPPPPVPPVAPAPSVAPAPAVPPLAPFPGLGAFDEGFWGVEENFFRSMKDDLQESMQNMRFDFQRQQMDLSRELRRIDRELEKIGSANGKERETLEKERADLEQKMDELQLDYQQDQAKADAQIRKAEVELNRKQAEMHRSLDRQQRAMNEAHARLNAEALAQVQAGLNAESLAEIQARLSESQAGLEAAMRNQKEHMKEHEAQMKVHEAQMKKHEAFLKALNEQLKKDGFLAGNGDVEFRMEKGQLYINEQLQPAEVYEKYRKLFEKHGQKPGSFHWKHTTD